MNEENALLKQEMRRTMRARLRDLPAARREQESIQAAARMERQEAWRNAKAVLFFAPRPDEMDLLPLLERALAEGKTAALPRFFPESGVYMACQIESFSRDCAPGKFGIGEPAARCPIFPLNRLDLALVPGLAFDVTGHRLGRGQGFYDRLLAEVAGTRCGVAFDEQMVEKIPAEPHDIALNCIITPTQWVEFPGQRPILP